MKRIFSPTPTGLESFSPGLAQQRLPWVNSVATNPERVESNLKQTRSGHCFNPYRVGPLFARTQGSGCAATLGYMLATLSGLPGGQQSSKDQFSWTEKRQTELILRQAQDDRFLRDNLMIVM
jgi:hypothetical protein